MTNLRGSLALVTGASSGIGRATALALASRGCRVVATGRDPSRLTEVTAQTGGEQVVADLTTDEGVAAVVAAVRATGVPDLLVLNAGAGLVRPAAEQPADEVRHLFRLNVEAPIRLCAELLPAIRQRRSGRLVFVTSVAAALGVAGESAYAATKAALQLYADSLRGELLPDGIVVTTVIPGVVDTDFFRRRGEAYPRRFPRPISAERVADALVRAVERDRAQVVVPPWLRLPIAVRAVLPESYARAASRFG